MKKKSNTNKKETPPSYPTRQQGWESRLNDHLEKSRKKPFEWGGNDCVLFSADVIQAMTGADPIPELRGKWTSKATARRVLKKHGGLEATAEKVANENGWRRVPNMLAQRGDLLLMQGKNGPLLAICVGASAIAPGESGMVTLPVGQAIKAWHIS